jgi:hypothetical protein
MERGSREPTSIPWRTCALLETSCGEQAKCPINKKLGKQAKRPMDKKLGKQAKRPMDKKLGKQAKRPMDKKLGEQAKCPINKKWGTGQVPHQQEVGNWPSAPSTRTHSARLLSACRLK